MLEISMQTADFICMHVEYMHELSFGKVIHLWNKWALLIRQLSHIYPCVIISQLIILRGSKWGYGLQHILSSVHLPPEAGVTFETSDFDTYMLSIINLF